MDRDHVGSDGAEFDNGISAVAPAGSKFMGSSDGIHDSDDQDSRHG